MDHCKAQEAIGAIQRLAYGEEMQRAVGTDRASSLAYRAHDALVAMQAGSPYAAAVPVTDLARECTELAAAVNCNFDDGTASSGGNDGEEWDWDWGFGAAVAEAVALGLCAAAFTLSPLSLEAQSEVDAMSLIEELSRELDCLAAYLFGGLSRLDIAGGDTTQEERLHTALGAVCTWALATVARAVGMSRFTASTLWEFASHDATWCIALSKGVLASKCTAGSKGVAGLLPPIEWNLELTAMNAVLGLAYPGCAFAERDPSLDLCYNLEDNAEMTIVERSRQLSEHRAGLARALVDCNAVALLIEACSQMQLMQQLALFLELLLQVGSSGGTPSAWEATDAMSCVLSHLQEPLWSALTSAVCSSIGQASLQNGVLRACAHIAFLVQPADKSLMSELIVCYLECCDVRHAAELAALCALAANSELEADGSPLAQALQGSQACEILAVQGHWKRWKGPLREPDMQIWSSLLGLVPSPRGGATAVSNAPVPAPAVMPSAPATPVSLRELFLGAPHELRCAIDGQLMLDPVQTPNGLTCERSTLGRKLQETNGMCPLSQEPLQLHQCQRIPDLRRQAALWVRQQRPRDRSRKPME